MAYSVTVSSLWRFFQCHRVDCQTNFCIFLSTEIYITSLSVTAVSNTDVWMVYCCAVTNYNCTTSLCPPVVRSALLQTGGALQKSGGHRKKFSRANREAPEIVPLPLSICLRLLYIAALHFIRIRISCCIFKCGRLELSSACFKRRQISHFLTPCNH